MALPGLPRRRHGPIRRRRTRLAGHGQRPPLHPPPFDGWTDIIRGRVEVDPRRPTAGRGRLPEDDGTPRPGPADLGTVIMRDFSNSTAVITGAASGMGYAFAERFAAEGMNVVLADIEADALSAAVSRLEQQERSVVGIEVDTMQRESIESLRDQAIDRFGNIHVLCNNAGVDQQRGRRASTISGRSPKRNLGLGAGRQLLRSALRNPNVPAPHGRPRRARTRSQHIIRRRDRRRLRSLQRLQARSPLHQRGPLSRSPRKQRKYLGQRALSRTGQHQPAQRRTQPTGSVRRTDRARRRRLRSRNGLDRRHGSRQRRRAGLGRDRQRHLLHPAPPGLRRDREGSSRPNPLEKRTGAPRHGRPQPGRREAGELV